ncbi:hypothetical protein AJ79_05754 [Helicocarpus griseus UAMH5409]|uniref:N-acetyltransferase domain-containing protein n=1 Tax=Helicocarpus griseus UAMH5409 TaxID=1447875 RepID=A0A2B7XJX6_9EURO|nr:hypothetical protein AJ79_05754 [Helicocarpus griseus UAMH5409]
MTTANPEPNAKPLARAKSGLTLHHATLSDIYNIDDLHARSFLPNDPFYQKLIPDTPLTRAWWREWHLRAFNDEGTIFLICKDGDTPVAISRWIKPAKEDGGIASDGFGGEETVDVHRTPEFSADHDVQLCDELFESFEHFRRKLMGRRRHYYLEYLGTIEEFKGEGAAGMMIRYMLEHFVDAEGVECYVDASQAGLHMYEKFGWVKYDEKPFPPVGGFFYTESYCVRPAQKKKYGV